MFCSPRSVAIVHDFLYCYGGAERVLEQMLQVFPDAHLFSLFDFLPEKDRAFIRGKTVKCSFIQKLPRAKQRHRAYFPLMPLAVEQLDVSKYDLVISSSYLAAKGILTRPDQLHLCYCHSPIRFAWDLQNQCLSEVGLRRGIRSMAIRALLHYMRGWDMRSANGVDAFMTNSHFVARRINKVYRRPSTPIYPPVDVESFNVGLAKEDFYLTASRMVPYKRIDLIVDAFNQMPTRRLVVIGEGPDYAKIKAKAAANITILGHQPFHALRSYMQRAKAFVFAAEEDFGIVPVEAQACGTPVIAFGRGGATETIVDGVTGLFFAEQTVNSLNDAVERFETVHDWDLSIIRRNAERFSAGRFRTQFSSFINAHWEAFSARCREGTSVNEDYKLITRDRLLEGQLSRSLGIDPVAAPMRIVGEVV